jgi:hypothetical protein
MVELLPADSLVGKEDKMPSVSGHHAAACPRRVGQLLPVRHLDVSHLKGPET